MESAAELLPSIPKDQLNKIARFLEGQGHKELALEIATDPEHKFELALSLQEINIAVELAREADVEHKWKTVGDAALTMWDIALATECFTNAKDLGSLLLLHTSTCNKEGLKALAEQASAAGAHNVAFSCLWQLGDVDRCIDILANTDRSAEAVLFAQTYKPSAAPKAVGLWKDSLKREKKGRVANIIGVPGEDEDLFPEWEEYLKLETEGGTATDDLIDVNGHADASAEEAVNGDADAEAETVEEEDATEVAEE